MCAIQPISPLDTTLLKVKAPEDRYNAKMNKMLQFTEREIKEIDFNPNPERLDRNIEICLKESNQRLCIQPSIMRIETLVQCILAKQT